VLVHFALGGGGGFLPVRILRHASYVRQQVIKLRKKLFVIDLETGWSLDKMTSVFERSVKIKNRTCVWESCPSVCLSTYPYVFDGRVGTLVLES
jgi:hypothetical protein